MTGRKVDHLTLKTLSGDPVTVSFRNQAEASVVYFTSASCRWCDDNLRYFSTLASAAADNHRLVIITDDSLTAGGPRPDLKGYETFVAAPDTLKEYQLDGVPQLVIIDRTGAVRGSWTGPWSNETVGEIQRLLMVKS